MDEKENLEKMTPTGGEDGNQDAENLENHEDGNHENENAENHEHEEPTKTDETKDVKKTFTQEEVNNLIKARLDRHKTKLFSRYGVTSQDELDTLIGKSQSYDVMKEKYDSISQENTGLKQRMAFINQNIDPAREEDVRIFFKGKGIELTEENLEKEVNTHPEWLHVATEDGKPKTTITALGIDHKKHEISESDEEKARRVWGI